MTSNQITCPGCNIAFKSDRALAMHCFYNEDCKEAFFSSFNVKNQANSNCLFSENESNCEFDRSNHIATDSLQQNDTTAPNDDAVMQPISRLNISFKNRQEKY
jgi:hypothetical protein